MYIENLDEIESAIDPYNIMDALLPGVKKRRSGHQLRSRCPVHGGDGDENFSLNLENHAWYCFSQGCKGRGLIDLYAKSKGMPFIDAAMELAGQFDVQVQSQRYYDQQGNFQAKCYRKSICTESSVFIPKYLNLPSDTWQKRASEFFQQSHQAALESPIALKLLKDRGFDLETIKLFRLGWNELNRKDAKNLWGFSEQDACNVNIWLPKGIVIPTFADGNLIKLKIRRVDLLPGEKRKYVVISGSSARPSFFGMISGKPIFIVEAELDAMLIQQEAGDLCCCMSIPASQHPDAYADHLLKAAPAIVFSLDYDEAGTRAFSFWRSRYPQLKIWLSDKGKSPGDDLKQGVNLREWVKAGLDSEII
jgi:hypothetical protein